MKNLSLPVVFIFILFFSFSSCKNEKKAEPGTQLIGNRFLTFNSIIRVNQIEVSRFENKGEDERSLHTPDRVIEFRDAIEKGFPGAKITWAFSWLAVHDTTFNYTKIRELVVAYHSKYGDEITFIPGAYFANAYNSTEQVNEDLHDGLAKVSELVGNGYRPNSVVAGFLSSKNQQFLAEKEGIHVCQGNIWSQYASDNQDGEGSVCYPFYPSKEHVCKPAQSSEDFSDCVNLDGWFGLASVRPIGGGRCVGAVAVGAAVVAAGSVVPTHVLGVVAHRPTCPPRVAALSRMAPSLRSSQYWAGVTSRGSSHRPRPWHSRNPSGVPS